MLVIDREGVVVFANPAAERLLGRATQALEGTRLGFPLVPGESSEIDVVAGPTPRTAEMRVVAIDWEGQPAALASLRDVTERKRAEDQLRRLSAELELRVHERTAQLEAAVSELEAFSYSVSHDLRTPLRAIHGFISMLEDQLGDDLPPEAVHSLERVKAGAKTMGTLIDELLKLSRLDRQPLAHMTVDLSALAHEIVAELRSTDPERDVDVRIQEGLRVIGDEPLLRIALANLLDNAFKFTRHTTNARVEVSGARVGENLSVRVRDNGAGFDPKLHGSTVPSLPARARRERIRGHRHRSGNCPARDPPPRWQHHRLWGSRPRRELLLHPPGSSPSLGPRRPRRQRHDRRRITRASSRINAPPPPPQVTSAPSSQSRLRKPAGRAH